MPRRIVRKKRHRRTSGFAGLLEPGYGSLLVRSVYMNRFATPKIRVPRPRARSKSAKRKKPRKRHWKNGSVKDKHVKRFFERTRASSY